MVERSACSAWLCRSERRMASSRVTRAPAAEAEFCCPAPKAGRIIKIKARKLPCFKGKLLDRPERRKDGLRLLLGKREQEPDCQTVGGARGAMLRGATRGATASTRNSSSRLTAGAISTCTAEGTTADPAAEQMGQTWESSVCEFRSKQQCNCAPNSTLARSATRKSPNLVPSRISPLYKPVYGIPAWPA